MKNKDFTSEEIEQIGNNIKNGFTENPIEILVSRRDGGKWEYEYFYQDSIDMLISKMQLKSRKPINLLGKGNIYAAKIDWDIYDVFNGKRTIGIPDTTQSVLEDGFYEVRLNEDYFNNSKDIQIAEKNGDKWIFKQPIKNGEDWLTDLEAMSYMAVRIKKMSNGY